MEALELLASGPFSTIQDLGRHGYMRYGVPPSGALDGYSYCLGNYLVGNARSAAAVEITMGGLSALALRDVGISVTGGVTSILVDGSPMPMWSGLLLRQGQRLDIGTITRGVRAYLSVQGGIDAPRVLGSMSTYVKGKIGGLDGGPLKQGDILSAAPPPHGQLWSLEHFPELSRFPLRRDAQDIALIRIVYGPQYDMFSADGIRAFETGVYSVTPQTDRMGVRLKGPRIEHLKGADIVSDGIPGGAIQVPADGQPIIMLADRQTTGGYAKIGSVVGADLGLIAQLRPGESVRFVPVTLEEAYDAWSHRRSVVSAALSMRVMSGPGTRCFRLRTGGREIFASVQELP